MTLYPLDGTTLDQVAEVAGRAVDPAFTVEQNVAGVEVRPRGIDKGVGAAWLAEQIDVPFSRFAGVGDSDPDLVFLRHMAWSAAPANATPAVRAAVDFVAPHEHGEGLLEIVERLTRVHGR